MPLSELPWLVGGMKKFVVRREFLKIPHSKFELKTTLLQSKYINHTTMLTSQTEVNRVMVYGRVWIYSKPSTLTYLNLYERERERTDVHTYVYMFQQNAGICLFSFFLFINLFTNCLIFSVLSLPHLSFNIQAM